MLTIVNAYYCNEGMLEKQYSNFRSLSPALRDHIEYVVTDDSTPEPYRKAWAEDIPGMAVQCYHGTGPDIPWNHAFARNVGCKHAAHPYLLVTDIDHMVTEEFLTDLLGGIASGHYFNTVPPLFNHRILYNPTHRIRAGDGSRYHPHPDSYVCTKHFWCDILGYQDERFRGGYGGNMDHKERIKARAEIDYDRLNVPLVLWGRKDIKDASTFNLQRKSSTFHARIKEIRSRLKRNGTYQKGEAFMSPYRLDQAFAAAGSSG